MPRRWAGRTTVQNRFRAHNRDLDPCFFQGDLHGLSLPMVAEYARPGRAASNDARAGAASSKTEAQVKKLLVTRAYDKAALCKAVLRKSWPDRRAAGSSLLWKSLHQALTRRSSSRP